VENVVPDSSWIIESTRRGEDPLRVLGLSTEWCDLFTCGVVRAEIGRGLKSPKLRTRFTDAWEWMTDLPTDHHLWAEVEELLWSLDRAGSRIPLPDGIIAASALRIDAVVLTLDKHFTVIRGLRTATSLKEIAVGGGC